MRHVRKYSLLVLSVMLLVLMFSSCSTVIQLETEEIKTAEAGGTWYAVLPEEKSEILVYIANMSSGDFAFMIRGSLENAGFKSSIIASEDRDDIDSHPEAKYVLIVKTKSMNMQDMGGIDYTYEFMLRSTEDWSPLCWYRISCIETSDTAAWVRIANTIADVLSGNYED